MTPDPLARLHEFAARLDDDRDDLQEQFHRDNASLYARTVKPLGQLSRRVPGMLINFDNTGAIAALKSGTECAS